MSRPMDVLRRKVEILEEHCAAVGRDPASITRTITFVAYPRHGRRGRAAGGRIAPGRRRGGVRRRPGRDDRPPCGAGRARLRARPARLPALPRDGGHRALPRAGATGVPTRRPMRTNSADAQPVRQHLALSVDDAPVGRQDVAVTQTQQRTPGRSGSSPRTRRTTGRRASAARSSHPRSAAPPAPASDRR